MELTARRASRYAPGGMSSGSQFRRAAKAKKPRTLTLEQLEDWLDTRDPPAGGVSMIDGYLAALVVSPQSIPPEEWLWPIVGDRIAFASDSSIEGAVRNTLFKRYNEISKTLSGGPKRYAPIYMRTDEGEVLVEDYANGFYLGMSLSMDDWQPFLADPEIAVAMLAILNHCDKSPTDDARIAAVEAQATPIFAQSWRMIPDIIEMLHQRLAGSRNIEIC